MANVPKQLLAIAKQVNAGHPVQNVTVRTLLSWFEAERRGYWITRGIQKALRNIKLRTDPNFEYAYIDSEIGFKPISKEKVAKKKAKGSGESSLIKVTDATPIETFADGQKEDLKWVASDPTYRIGKLYSANQKVVSVAPDAKLQKAITTMLTNDFSQLPVMQGEREVKGIISWRSIGSRLSLGKTCKTAKDCMEAHQEVNSETSIFAVIEIVAEHEYVLVRSQDKRITGIVTSSDLSLQFRQLAEPFLLIGEIENHLRSLIGSKFTSAEIAKVRDPEDTGRVVDGVVDLTFGEYTRLLQDPSGWEKVSAYIDRATFIELLDRVREIRNDVMHFDPDGLSQNDLGVLRKFTGFFQRLRTIQAGI